MQNQPQPAQLFFDQLRHWMNSFHANLRQDEYTVALYEDPVGNTITIRQIGFTNPHMIVLVGDDSYGNRSVVLAHLGSVQIILKAVRRTENTTEQPKKMAIGFLGDKLSLSPNAPTQ